MKIRQILELILFEKIKYSYRYKNITMMLWYSRMYTEQIERYNKMEKSQALEFFEKSFEKKE